MLLLCIATAISYMQIIVGRSGLRAQYIICSTILLSNRLHRQNSDESQRMDDAMGKPLHYGQ